MFSSGDRLVQIIHISLVVFAMMDLHGSGIDMGLQCFVRIRKGW
jgi:hypothetical protein